MENELYYEDYEVGMRFKGRYGRTVTDYDNIIFTLLTCNTNQIHFNKDYTEKNFPGEPFKGRLIVNGLFTLSTVIGIMTEKTGSNVFMLGLDNVKFLKPVFSNDTIYAESVVKSKRESETRKNAGIVCLETYGYNQMDEKVIQFDRYIMVLKRGKVWE